ncbi:tellurite resistance TerB family protein [Shewanella surugensis]|uniref:TerB family tellurite resistance protein n=1 Tax=Shewanella surugensis TaxID=212020 RepID=A0ABT0LCV3_9GAMM|nr:TerB family tellurite resistance protein [Shewanella surugensis]MCL1125157.1 TerB family tellurite resistance protein [Shewanella surugensis]
MIEKLKQFLNFHAQELPPEEKAKHLNVAAACLLLEVIYADESFSAEEANLLPELLSKALKLNSNEVEQLISDAKRKQKKSTSLYEFTSEINEQCSIEQKQQLILAMWRLAYADGHLCQYEDHLIRRMAELLYLKHSELIQMRNLALKTL